MEVEKTKSKKRGTRLIAALLTAVLLNAAVLPVGVHAEETERVRVGFFAFDGYHMIDSHGGYSGYGYDYLQYLARYADFAYMYVGHDKSWSEMQDMLADGQIDLLTSARKTEERLERFDFSDQPIGYSAAILTVKAGDDRYMVGDYTKLDGIRIGLLKDNSRNQDLEKFAREQGFTYQAVLYEDSAALAEALQQGGEIDAILTSNLRKIDNEWIIATFDSTPFYIMVRKGNRQLLDRINDANARLQMDHRDLPTVLFDRYYTANNRDKIAYTAEERQYIEAQQKSGNPIRIAISSGREPISYFDGDDHAAGIIPEVAREVLRRTGLTYEFVETPAAGNAWSYLVNGKADVRFDGSANLNDAENYGVRITDPYLELPVSYITRKEFSGKPSTVAIVDRSNVIEEYVEQTYDDASIVRYTSVEDCLDAVLSGRQDAAYFQSYIAQRLVNSDIRNRIKEQLVPGYEMSFAISVLRSDSLLFSILDKAVFSMTADEIDRIVLEQTSRISQDVSLLGYLYAHPTVWLVLLAIVACFTVILTLYLSRRKNLRLEKERARELERFISYVCKANDTVVEVDLAGRTYRSYQVEDGRVCHRRIDLKEEKLQIAGLCPEDRENVNRLTDRDALLKLIETGGELYFECRVRAPGRDGPYQWFAYTLQGVPKDERGPGTLMVFIKNVDAVKREEEEKRQVLQDALTAAQQANEARGAFLSRMSHEIRTPLNAIIGYMTIAGANLRNGDKVEESLKKSEFAAHQLLNIVNDVLDISAIESGRMKIAHEAFNIRQLLSGITSIFHAQAAEKDVKFSVRLSDLTEEELIGDQLRLNQILMNLLSNAVKFTPAGGEVTLAVRQKALVQDSVYLQFQVEDTGIGMSESYKKRLFMPFEQQDATTAQKFGGTGLGLSITKNLVSMMNGSIEVKSEEGRGTVFTVSLSFEIPQGRQGAAAPHDFTHLQTLLLYGENGDGKYIQTMLSRLGVSFDLAASLEEAAEKIELKKDRGDHYDLCLIDWDLPDGAGPKAAEKISAASPHGPVLVAVAYESPTQQMKAGLIEGVVTKPVFISSLFDMLSNVCQRHMEPKAQDARREDFGLQGVRVLLAEDNELNMEIAREILTQYGLTIDGALNGQEAAERFEASAEGTYQAILMDIQMPVMNGYEATARIRAGKHPQAATVPIIALTADAFAEDINRALAAGMNGHVSKPIDFNQLCRVLSDRIRPGTDRGGEEAR